jgi:hypothetical protein
MPLVDGLGGGLYEVRTIALGRRRQREIEQEDIP